VKTNNLIQIRKATIIDYEEVWKLFQKVIQTGDTYVFNPKSPKSDLKKYWFAASMHSYVAILNKIIVGTYIVKPNQPDLGSHIANASYMVHPKYQGKKIGFKMGLHSLEEAKKIGFKAMQFNLVVKTNEAAVHLWKKLGFQIIGEIPEAFQHQQLGLTNAYIMYQKL